VLSAGPDDDLALIQFESTSRVLMATRAMDAAGREAAAAAIRGLVADGCTDLGGALGLALSTAEAACEGANYASAAIALFTDGYPQPNISGPERDELLGRLARSHAVVCCRQHVRRQQSAH